MRDLNKFQRWRRTVDALCEAHLGVGWDDLCGDQGPLEQAFAAGDTPLAFVRWWAERYDLAWIDAAVARLRGAPAGRAPRRSEVETAAGLAATMAQSHRFSAWLDHWGAHINGWCGFIDLCVEAAPVIEARATAQGGWEVCDWYLTLDVAADQILIEGPEADLTTLACPTY